MDVLRKKTVRVMRNRVMGSKISRDGKATACEYNENCGYSGNNTALYNNYSYVKR